MSLSLALLHSLSLSISLSLSVCVCSLFISLSLSLLSPTLSLSVCVSPSLSRALSLSLSLSGLLALARATVDSGELQLGELGLLLSHLESESGGKAAACRGSGSGSGSGSGAKVDGGGDGKDDGDRCNSPASMKSTLQLLQLTLCKLLRHVTSLDAVQAGGLRRLTHSHDHSHRHAHGRSRRVQLDLSSDHDPGHMASASCHPGNTSNSNSNNNSNSNDNVAMTTTTAMAVTMTSDAHIHSPSQFIVQPGGFGFTERISSDSDCTSSKINWESDGDSDVDDGGNLNRYSVVGGNADNDRGRARGCDRSGDTAGDGAFCDDFDADGDDDVWGMSCSVPESDLGMGVTPAQKDARRRAILAQQQDQARCRCRSTYRCSHARMPHHQLCTNACMRLASISLLAHVRMRACHTTVPRTAQGAGIGQPAP